MDYAILMASDNKYAFCVANVLMSLRDHSPAVFARCDFIIYHRQMSERNRAVLQELGGGRVVFREIRAEASPWLDAACCRSRHVSMGEKYGMEALHAFEWLHAYRRVLWLEADTFIRRPIDDLLALDCELGGLFGKPARRSVPGPFTHLLRDPADSPWQFVQSAVLLFSDRLLRCAISPAQLRARAEEYGTEHPNGGMAGVQELFIPYLAYYYRMQTAVIPRQYNVTLGELQIASFNDAAIQHFASGYNKPWLSGHLYHLYPEFGVNLRKFKELGGGTLRRSILQPPASSTSATPLRFCITSISSAARSKAGPLSMTRSWNATSLPAAATCAFISQASATSSF